MARTMCLSARGYVFKCKLYFGRFEQLGIAGKCGAIFEGRSQRVGEGGDRTTFSHSEAEESFGIAWLRVVG